MFETLVFIYCNILGLIFIRKYLKINVNPKIEKILKYLMVLHIIFLIIVYVHPNELRGYKSETFLLIVTVFIAVAYYLYSSINIILRYLFLVVLTISLVFTGLISSFSLANYPYGKYLDNSKYRIEEFASIIGGLDPPHLFVKNRLFEKRYKLTPKRGINDFHPLRHNKKNIDSIKISQKENDYEVKFYMKNGEILILWSKKIENQFK